MAYYTDDVNIHVGRYDGNGNTALSFTTKDGEPVCKATTNLGDSLLPNYAYIKDYAENEGVLETLIRANIVEQLPNVVQTNHVDIYMVQIISDRVIKMIEALDDYQKVTKLRFGFKGKNQLPLFMVWKEWWEDGDVVYAKVLFNSMRWIGV